ncbi:monocarboxylate uptake permease MctP [Paraburkholderia caballeronis]|uniref:Solute:Na+ symporter, SSS family n=1 Tax=Paraburkholderia caballeronis TaxID=416943 RepID=A0A1H7T6B4_9BURK|nr:sodium:solute symporter [Paraburkholderia caballeronis]PXW22730.1 SSS family solute:Na+ symporter [Paraburkholderia caballeronis]PXW96833.1 SSS family solute:Na+ symporter [Paraburkholderia caballeronis]RAJ93460.1 SSS family solute:Na+ symporter [Paraburkholderia caballeronis]TDV12183.1 SSS family solute:Na+ symporter [Paraburkholderia caballeronis]TDV15258.1 SSS family solute:Na+ symporter [Paraburkholderia caballeronis]
MNVTATFVFILFFVGVTILGFVAAHWRRGNLAHLDEWGLGGRRFGTFVTWFLLGGDLYTAYTFVAVPALVFGAGATGFFALPYTILIYPFAFVVFPKLWAIAKRHNYVTSADFVSARYGSRMLALAIAVTGIVATMPYIALQLVGIEVVIGALGFDTTGFVGDLPLIIAFAILAAYTYTSGLRAPAMIAVVKDVLIYITIIAAIIVIPAKMGGFGHIFAAVPPEKLLLKSPDASSLNGYSAYATLAVGSALALFLYPHSITAVLSSSSGNTIRRNMAMLPAYSLVLGLLALLGFMALAAGVKDMPEFAPYFKAFGPSFAVPALFLHFFPSWFVGVAFAAIGIGALVPAAIMSIAAANLYTRNIHKEFINRRMSHEQETNIAKLVSLIVKVGAVAFILGLPLTYAIQLQLLGGIWIIQTLPAIVLGLYTRVLDYRGLLVGWAAGIATGTYMAVSLKLAGSIYVIHLFGLAVPGYAAVWALVVNLVVSVAVSALVHVAGAKKAEDRTRPEDYLDVVEG